MYILVLCELYMLAIAHHPSREIVYNLYISHRPLKYRLTRYLVGLKTFYLTSPLAISATRFTKSGNWIYLIFLVPALHYYRIMLPINLLFYLVFFISFRLFFFNLCRFILYYTSYLLYRYQYFCTVVTVFYLNFFFKNYSLRYLIVMYITPFYTIYCLLDYFVLTYDIFFLNYFIYYYFLLSFIFLLKNFYKLFIYLYNYIRSYILFWYKLFLKFFTRLFIGKKLLTLANINFFIIIFKVITLFFIRVVFFIPSFIMHNIWLPKVYVWQRLTIIVSGELITIYILEYFSNTGFYDFDEEFEPVYENNMYYYYKVSVYIYLGSYIAYFLYIY